MIAYHGDANIKTKYLARVKAHREADELIHGTGWQNGKGCAIGCTLEAYNHALYETELGIPRQVARLEDSIFEGLKNGKAQAWPEMFLEAIKPGADLSNVFPQFIIWLLVDTKDGVVRYASPDGEKAIRAVAALYQRHLDGDEPKESEWAVGTAWAVEAVGAAERQADKLIELLEAA